MMKCDVCGGLAIVTGNRTLCAVHFTDVLVGEPTKKDSDEQSRLDNQRKNILYRLNEAKEVMKQANMENEATLCNILIEAVKENKAGRVLDIIAVGTITSIRQIAMFN